MLIHVFHLFEPEILKTNIFFSKRKKNHKFSKLSLFFYLCTVHTHFGGQKFAFIKLYHNKTAKRTKLVFVVFDIFKKLNFVSIKMLEFSNQQHSDERRKNKNEIDSKVTECGSKFEEKNNNTHTMHHVRQKFE